MGNGKVYLAARYSRRDELRALASHFRLAGFMVTSRWLYEDKPLNTQLGDDSPIFYQETAQVDLDDIDKADTLVFFAEDPHVGVPRGGRHWECGYAYAKGKRIITIGGPENIFGYLSSILNFPTLNAFLEYEGVTA